MSIIEESWRHIKSNFNPDVQGVIAAWDEHTNVLDNVFFGAEQLITNESQTLPTDFDKQMFVLACAQTAWILHAKHRTLPSNDLVFHHLDYGSRLSGRYGYPIGQAYCDYVMSTVCRGFGEKILEETIHYATKALNVFEANPGFKYSNLAGHARINLALGQMYNGQLQEAETNLQHAKNCGITQNDSLACQYMMAAEGPVNVRVWINLAQLKIKQKKYREALLNSRLAFNQIKTNGSVPELKLAYNRMVLADCLSKVGIYEAAKGDTSELLEAISEYNKARSAYESKFTPVERTFQTNYCRIMVGLTEALIVLKVKDPEAVTDTEISDVAKIACSHALNPNNYANYLERVHGFKDFILNAVPSTSLRK